MNKSVILSSVAVAMLVFSGCSSTKPTVDQTTKTGLSATSQESSSVDASNSVDKSAQNGTDQSNSNSSSNAAGLEDIQKTMSSVFFDFDKFEIRDDMKSNVTNDANVAKAAAAAYKVKLEGNCDEWGSDEYNDALGLKRAQTVKTALINDGVDASRISMVSLGKNSPVCKEKTKECWAQNRRVDFKLLP
jgi:peptidoglycan-associated lipoprotein